MWLDDMRLSFNEFASYFGDEFLNRKDLQDIFVQFAGDQTTLSVEEVSELFLNGFEPYVDAYYFIEKLHKYISSSLAYTAQNYHEKPLFTQFKIRFFLRYFLMKLDLVQKPIEDELERLGGQTTSNKRDFLQETRRQRQQNIVLNPETNLHLISKIHEVAGQINQLEHRINKVSLNSDAITLDIPTGTTSKLNSEKYAVIVTIEAKLKITDEHVFQALVKAYHADAAQNCYCLHWNRLEDDSNKDEVQYVLNEIWQNKHAYDNHWSLKYAKIFQKEIARYLVFPLHVNVMPLPLCWLG